MEEKATNLRDDSTSGNEANPALTPHQLYNHHLQHPDEPITDEDIKNLKIDTGGVFQDHQLTKEEATKSKVDEDESNVRDNVEEYSSDDEKPKTSPYDILGG